MRAKIKFLIIIILNIASLIGLWIVICDLAKINSRSITPYYSEVVKIVPYALGSLPIAGIIMILKKNKWAKILGVIYLIGTGLTLFLLEQAWV